MRIEKTPVDLKGREIIVEALLSAHARGQVGHAYLFTGPTGIGKKTLAAFWARVLNCYQSEPPCLECLSCRKALYDNHPDILRLKPRGVSLKIEQFREIKESLFLVPYEGKRRVVIIEEAQELTMAAANSLLKILEEPPSELVFILLSSKPWSLLPTILSRCLIFNLSPLPPEIVTEVVQSQLSVSREKASFAVALAGGIPGRALNFLARERETEEEMEYMLSLLEMLEGSAEEKFFSQCEELARRKDLDLLLESLGVILRDRMTWQATGRRDLLLGTSLPGTETAGGYRASERKWRILEQTRQDIKDNVNPRLALEAMYWQMRGVI